LLAVREERTASTTENIINNLNKTKAAYAISAEEKDVSGRVKVLFSQFFTEEQLSDQNMNKRLTELSSQLIDEDHNIDWDVIMELIQVGRDGIRMNGDSTSSTKLTKKVFLKGSGPLVPESAHRFLTAKRIKVIDWVYDFLNLKKSDFQATPGDRLDVKVFFDQFFLEWDWTSRSQYDFVFFLKQQVGVREISIAETPIMLMNKYCESLSRSICSFLPCDYSDSGSTKDFNYSSNVRLIHGMRRKEEAKGRQTEMSNKSGDKKSWCKNFPTMAVPLIVSLLLESEDAMRLMTEQSHFLSNRRYHHEYETLKRKLSLIERPERKAWRLHPYLFNDKELQLLEETGTLRVYDLTVNSRGSFPQGFMQMGSSLFHSASVMLSESAAEWFSEDFLTTRIDQISMLTSDDSLRLRLISSAEKTYPKTLLKIIDRFDEVTDQLTNMIDSEPKTVKSMSYTELNQRVMFASSISSTPFKGIMQSQQPLNSITLKECASESVSRAQSCLYEGSSLMTSSLILQLQVDFQRRNLKMRMPGTLQLTDKGDFPLGWTIESLLFSVDAVQKRLLLSKTEIFYSESMMKTMEELLPIGVSVIELADVLNWLLIEMSSKISHRLTERQASIARIIDVHNPGLTAQMIGELLSALEVLSEAYHFRLSDLNDASFNAEPSFSRISTSAVSGFKTANKLRKMKINRASVKQEIAGNPTYFMEDTLTDALLSLKIRYLNPKSGSGDLTSPVSNYLRISMSRHMSYTLDSENMVFYENIPAILEREMNKLSVNDLFLFSTDLRLMNSTVPLISAIKIPEKHNFQPVSKLYSYNRVSIRTQGLFSGLSTVNFFRRWVSSSLNESDKLSLKRLAHIYRFPEDPKEISVKFKRLSEEECKLRYSSYLKEIYSLITRSKNTMITMLCKGGGSQSVMETSSKFFLDNTYSQLSLSSQLNENQSNNEIDRLIVGLVSMAGKISHNEEQFSENLGLIKDASIDNMNIERYVLSLNSMNKKLKENVYYKAFFGLERSDLANEMNVNVNYNKAGGISSITSCVGDRFISSQLVSRRVREIVLRSDSTEYVTVRKIVTNIEPDDEDLFS